MKKNKGFTLTELLAVLVILAILALIATPIITTLIRNSKIRTSERAIEGLLDSIDVYYGRRIIEDNGVFNNNNLLYIAFGTSYDESEVGLINGNTDLEYNGTRITGGRVSLDRYKKIEIVEPLRVNNYYCIKDAKNNIKCTEEEPEI